ncbi:MAG TPA: glycosyltransferase family 4 protein [Terrimicrobiaceae bacterium]
MVEPPRLVDIGLVRRGYSATGGAEAYLLRLAAGLQAKGCKATLYTTRDWPSERWTFGDLIRLDASHPLQFARAFQRARRPGQIVLSLDRIPGCDVFRAGDGVHAAWLERRSHFESAWRRRLRIFNWKHAALLALERQVFENVRAVIANSRMVAREILHWHDFPEEKIHIVPNGIGRALSTISQRQARQQLEIPEHAFCALFVGTGWERKGLRFAIEAVEALGGDALLLVAGRGNVRQFSSARAKFVGATDNLVALYSAADVFTLPTIYDPFSNACLEALAAGLPVVTTTANGFSEIVTPGVHGDIVEPGDVRALTHALECWKERNSARTSADCQQLAKDYSIERNVNATLDLLMAVGPAQRKT